MKRKRPNNAQAERSIGDEHRPVKKDREPNIGHESLVSFGAFLGHEGLRLQFKERLKIARRRVKIEGSRRGLTRRIDPDVVPYIN